MMSPYARVNRRTIDRGSPMEANALAVQTVPITSANTEDANASRAGVRGSFRRSLMRDESSPTTAVKVDIATIVPTPNAIRYVEAMRQDGIVSAGSTPNKWPDPEQPCKIPVPRVDTMDGAFGDCASTTSIECCFATSVGPSCSTPHSLDSWMPLSPMMIIEIPTYMTVTTAQR